MSYPRGQMDTRVKLWNTTTTTDKYGGTSVRYAKNGEVWAWVTSTRGARSLHAGNVDIYQFKMVRCDIHANLTERTRLEIDGKYYIIDSFTKWKDKNETQITCYEIEDINQATTQQAQ